ncbi:MAG: hypothetical protein J6R72_00425 [Candidatus Methanomethylophilaceae archaeon]|jgi:hypothetical protein|nr:hypothetical protein [Candidatus Methanomethylophilaceae archaeon]
MQTRPTSLSVGALAAALGGAASIGAMAMTVDLGTMDAIGQVCYYLLTAIVFFAVAGGYKQNGQWPVELMILMNFVIIGLLVVGAIIDVIGIWIMVGLLVLELISLITVLGCLSSSVWFGSKA